MLKVIFFSFLTVQLAAFADEPTEKELAVFWNGLHSAYQEAKPLSVGFFSQKQAMFHGECVEKVTPAGSKKSHHWYEEAASLSIFNRNKLGKTSLYYGQEHPETIVRIIEDYWNGEKHSAAFADKEGDLVQDLVRIGGGGEGPSEYYNHVGRTYLRKGTFHSKSVYFFVFQSKTYKLGSTKVEKNTHEICYFEY